MDEDFEIPVMYKGKELFFPARLLAFGYTQKIEVDVYETLFHFERDEERQWRAVRTPEATETNLQVEVELLEQIAFSIEMILR